MSKSSVPSCPISYYLDPPPSESSYGIPTFTPTWAQFQDFNAFMRTVHPIGQSFGLIKVIPPPEWSANKHDYHDIPSSYPIYSPIAQNVTGKAGIFKVLNVKAADQVSVKRFYDGAQKEESDRSLRERRLAEACDWPELQQRYWKNIGIMARAPVYGADSLGSLTDSDQRSWNMRDLRSLLNVLGASIGGVTIPFLYYGTWASSFAWHVEDCNLYSMN